MWILCKLAYQLSTYHILQEFRWAYWDSRMLVRFLGDGLGSTLFDNYSQCVVFVKMHSVDLSRLFTNFFSIESWPVDALRCKLFDACSCGIIFVRCEPSSQFNFSIESWLVNALYSKLFDDCERCIICTGSTDLLQILFYWNFGPKRFYIPRFYWMIIADHICEYAHGRPFSCWLVKAWFRSATPKKKKNFTQSSVLLSVLPCSAGFLHFIFNSADTSVFDITGLMHTWSFMYIYLGCSHK